jgi:hypothetical protein
LQIPSIVRWNGHAEFRTVILITRAGGALNLDILTDRGFFTGIWRARPASVGTAAPTPTTDFRHVRAVYTHLFTALSSSLSGFFGGKLVSAAFFVRGTTAFAGDFALFLTGH